MLKGLSLFCIMLINGKYKPVCMIGQGTYSRVYKARHIEKNYDVAIKMSLKDNSISATLIQHEINMYLILKKNKISNIVGIKAFGIFEDCPFLIMEYLPYGIEEYMTSCLPDTQDKLINKMFSLLSLLHNHDIVHRDIKPDNFMISSKGTLYLIDLGLACVYDDCSKKNKNIIGTPLFCSYRIHQPSFHYEARDDNLSLFYVIFYILSGGDLPWKSLCIKDNVKKSEITALLKEHTHYGDYYHKYNNACLQKWVKQFEHKCIQIQD